MGFDGFAPADLVGYNLAVELSESLIKTRKLTRQPHLPGWAKEFDKRCRTISPVRVERVLKWYAQNLDKPYMPRAYSAGEFCKKFEAIEAAMTVKDQQLREERIQLPPEVERIVVRLTNAFLWPVEVHSKLGLIVHKSRERFRDFAEKCKARRGAGLNTRDDRFLGHLQELKLYTGMVEHEWMPLQHARIGRLEHYSGDPMGLVLDPTGELFKHSCWHQWSREWCGAWWAFDRLLESINK